MQKLSPAQERAKAKLTDQWQCAYDMQERLPTLRALVKLGVAVKWVAGHGHGATFCPRVTIGFKLSERDAPA